MKDTEQNIQGLWDNYKRCNICIMGIAEGEKKSKRMKELFETIMTENFLKLMPGTKP